MLGSQRPYETHASMAEHAQRAHTERRAAGGLQLGLF